MNTTEATSVGDGYVMDRSDVETDRLRIQSGVYDKPTRAVLEEVGLDLGMSALDAGCGGGDVMRLMAQRVGSEGSVTGLDVDGVLGRSVVEGLEGELDARVDFVEGDVLDAKLPAAGFDLTFARFLLLHLEDPVAALRRLWGWTASGGCTAIVDYDFRTVSGEGGVGELLELQTEVFEHAGRDMHFGAKLPQCFERACGSGPDQTAVTGLLGRVDALEPWLAATFRSFLPAAKRFGLETEERTARFFAALEEDSHRYVLGPLVVSAWKRKDRAAGALS